MAALAREIHGADEPRDIHELCVEWGSWARCAEPGRRGSAEGYLRERTDAAHAGEPTEEIALTDRAVAKMRVYRRDYWGAFARYYLNPTAISEYEISLDLGQPVERVGAMLRQARIMVGYQRRVLQNVVESLQDS